MKKGLLQNLLQEVAFTGSAKINFRILRWYCSNPQYDLEIWLSIMVEWTELGLPASDLRVLRKGDSVTLLSNAPTPVHELT